MAWGAESIACRLFIARGLSEGQQFVISEAEARLGRAESNDVVLTDPGVSNVHARIMLRDGRWWVEDLASQNGTLLNGAKVKGAAMLTTGDAVALGTVLVGFAEVADSSSRPRLSPQGIPPSGRRATSDVLMAGLPVRRPPRQKEPQELVTASGEGGQRVDFAELDAEFTSPSGLNRKGPEEGTAPEGKPLETLDGSEDDEEPPPKRRGHDVTNIDAPPPSRPLVVDLDDGPATMVPITNEPTNIGPMPVAPPARPSVLVPRPSAPRSAAGRPATVPPLGPRPSAPLRPKSEVGPSTDPQRPAAMAEPVLVPRPSAPKLSEGDTGPRTGNAGDLGDQETRARAPIVAEPAPLGMRAPLPVEETRIHAIGPPSTSRPIVSQTRPVVPTVNDPAPSAADRARLKREAGQNVYALVHYRWSLLGKKARVGLGVGVAGLLAVAGLGAVVLGSGPERRVMPKEPQVLVPNETVSASFGLGPGVDYEHLTDKQFKFSLNAPTQAAVLVHLHAQDIGHDELGVFCNGNEVGMVPEDLGVPNRELEVLIPPRPLIRGSENVLSFENHSTNVGKETWRISELRLEVIAIPPEVREGQNLDEARRLAKVANDLLQSKEIPTSNIYKAWKLYRQSWILLLGLPEDKRTTLWADGRRRFEELGRELDQRCGALLLEAKKQMELHNPDQAKEMLEEVPTHFPGKEHRCQTLARQKLDEYEL